MQNIYSVLGPMKKALIRKVKNAFIFFFSLINAYKKIRITRIDVYETLCPEQMLVHKGGKI